MGGLFSSKTINTSAQKLTGMQLQTSAYGAPVPIVIGTQRVPANLIDYDNFTAIPHTTTSGGGGGGSGGGGVKSKNTTYTYTVACILALCEGSATLGKVWADKDITTVAKLGFTVHAGARSQAPDTWWLTHHPTKALGYGGTCYVSHPALDLGDSASLKNHTFEVGGFLVPVNTDPAYPDAHPDEILPFLLTDPYVSPGWDPTRLGDLSTGAASYRAYCTACGLFISPLLNEQKPAFEWLQEILEATNSEPVWTSSATGMTLKIVPYGDQPVTGNGATFTPNVTPIYDLTVDDFEPAEGDDPVQVKITSQAESFNNIPIEFLDRAIDYNTNVLSDPDQVDIDTYQERKDSSHALHCITRASVALQISGIKARRSVNCRNHYKFRLGWRYILLEPMDLVTLTEPLLGLDHKVVRILTIEEDEESYLSFDTEEWPFGVATATLFTPQTGDGLAQDTNADPGNAFGPVAWEAPALYSGGARQLILSASGSALWGGCEVWISEDNTTYNRAGNIATPGRHGHLVGAFASGTSLDETNVLHVQLDDSRGQLASVSDKFRDELQTLSWVDGELLAYKTATLTGVGAYDLSSLRRGAYGTLITAHATLTKFSRVDGSCLKLDLPATRTGPLYIKLQSYNIWGGGLQDLATLPVFSYSLSGQISLEGAAITGLTSAFRSGQTWVIWDALAISGIQYEVRKGSSWASGLVLGVISQNEIQTQGDGTYWVAARLDNAVGTPSAITITGSSLVANVVQTYNEDFRLGTLSGGAVVTAEGLLRLTGSTTFDNLVGNFDSLVGLFDDLSGLSTTGEYISPNILDLGLSQPFSVKETYGFSTLTPATSSAQTFMRIDKDDGAGWGPWQVFAPGQFYGRKIERKVVLTCTDLAGSSPFFGPWSWTVDMPDRFESLTPLVTPSTGYYTWTYTRPFMVPPNVQLTVLDGAASDVIVDDGKDATHSSFHVTNGGVTVIRTINALAQGY